jgi:putative SOS response-associated peptidase YedK
MCGRYSLTTPVEGLRQLFEFPEQPNLQPRYNIAPTQEVAVVRAAPAGAGEAGKGGHGMGGHGEGGAGRHLVLLRWGLIPFWARDSGIGARLINARAETLAEKPAFRTAFRQRRCLVPADGFYEWQKRGGGPKQPYRIARGDGAPFAFAGLWERWRDPAEGLDVETCTIVTRDANARLRPIHDRMPEILAPDRYDVWLDPATETDRLQALLAAEPAAEPTVDLVATAISTRVNKVANDDPEVLLPLQDAGAGDAGRSGQAKLL